MSGVFNHGLDAYESMIGGDWGEATHGDSAGYAYNPLHYHLKIEHEGVTAETDKALQFKKFGRVFWLPKKIIREREDTSKSFYAHRDTYIKLMKEQVVIL